MIRTTLASLTDDQIASAYNSVYTGYLMPFNVDAGWVRRMVKQYAIAVAHSPVWLDAADEPIAMAALGVRNAAGWVGGFGVAPPYRGRGLSHELAAGLLACARSAGVSRLTLEVIAHNTPAIRVYARAGFARTRDLLILARTEPSPAPGPIAAVGDGDATPELIAARARMAAPAPAWQRDWRSLRAIAGLRALVAGSPSTPQAVAFYRQTEDGLRLVDLAAENEDAGRDLVAALVRRAPQLPLVIDNEPQNSLLLPALRDAGWREIMRQHEMAIDIDGPGLPLATEGDDAIDDGQVDGNLVKRQWIDRVQVGAEDGDVAEHAGP